MAARLLLDRSAHAEADDTALRMTGVGPEGAVSEPVSPTLPLLPRRSSARPSRVIRSATAAGEELLMGRPAQRWSWASR